MVGSTLLLSRWVLDVLSGVGVNKVGGLLSELLDCYLHHISGC